MSVFPIEFSGRRVMVAGSTQGIGLATAQLFARLGAHCTLVARNENKLQLALQSLEQSAGQMHDYLIADFSTPDAVKLAAEQYFARNTVDILINNSGGPAAGMITEASPEAFLAAFNQHLICNQILTTNAINGMKSNSWGRVVNIISTSVKIPLKGLGVSNTIRAAVASWAKTMANELAQFGITVNNVLPGATATGRLVSIIDGKSKKAGLSQEEVTEEMLAEIPARRFGQPEEIAAMVVFLSSAAAGYVTGTSIPVDGGRTGSI